MYFSKMKIILYCLVAIVAISIIGFWYQTYIQGRYYEHAGMFFALIIGALPLLIIYLSYSLIKTIKNEKSI